MSVVFSLLHVLGSILFLGPVAVAVSLFPRHALIQASAAAEGSLRGRSSATPERSASVVQFLHRITRTYGVLLAVIPVAGIVLAVQQDRLTETWIVASMVLTAIAGGLLALRIVPMQREAIELPDAGRRLQSLGAVSGVFNLLWVAVLVLMILRPGAR